MNNLKLITSVKKREILYNANLESHKNFSARESKWKEVAAELGITVPLCKKRWNCLKLNYTRAKTRRVMKKPWTYEREMEFMKPFLDGKVNVKRSRLRSRNANNENNNEDNLLPWSRTMQENSTEAAEKRLNPDASFDRLTPIAPCTPLSETVAPSPHVLDSVSLAGKHSHVSHTSSRDILNKYFETVIETVRDFPLTLQIKVKWEISKIIHQAEMEHVQQIQTEPYMQADNNSVQSTSMLDSSAMHLQFAREYTPMKFE